MRCLAVAVVTVFEGAAFGLLLDVVLVLAWAEGLVESGLEASLGISFLEFITGGCRILLRTSPFGSIVRRPPQKSNSYLGAHEQTRSRALRAAGGYPCVSLI